MENRNDRTYYKDMKDITAQYYLTERQRARGNIDQTEIAHTLHEKNSQRLELHRNLRLLKVNQDSNENQANIAPLFSALEQVELPNSNLVEAEKQKKRLLKQLENKITTATDENTPLNPIYKTILDTCIEYLKILLEIDYLNTRLHDLNFVHLQAENYHLKLRAFEETLGRANNIVKALQLNAKQAYAHDNYIIQAWNHWVDARNLNAMCKLHDDTQVNLTLVLRTLMQADKSALANKTGAELEAELFIIDTLTLAYNRIDVLMRGARTTKELEFQNDIASKLHDVHHRCNLFTHSGNPYLRYIGGLFLLLTAIIVIVTVTGLGMYLGGGAAAAIVISALTALQAAPLIASLAAAAGCSLALITPACLAASGTVAATATGLCGLGFWNSGSDKNDVSRGARKAATNLLSLVHEPAQQDAFVSI